MGFRSSILAGTRLVRQAIMSPNYVAGIMGWSINRDGSAEFNNLTIRGEYKGMNYEQNEYGVFFYSGTPAYGNLIASIATAAGKDVYLNSYVAGICAYQSGDTFAQLANGSLALGIISGGVPDTADAGTVVPVATGITNSVTFQSPTNVAVTDPLWMTLVSGVPGATTGQPGAPYVQVIDRAASSAADLTISGSLIKTSTGGIRETWHTPVMGPGWATGPGGTGSYPPLKWRYDAEDNIHIFGTFHVTSTSPGLIASGLPTINQSGLGGVSIVGGSPRFQGAAGTLALYVNGNGELRNSVGLAFAVGDSFMVNSMVPLGNIN